MDKINREYESKKHKTGECELRQREGKLRKEEYIRYDKNAGRGRERREKRERERESRCVKTMTKEVKKRK